MDDRGKSDDLIVPAKLPNNALGGAAEAVEGRGSPKGNAPAKHAPDAALEWACQVIWTACAVWRGGQGCAVHRAPAPR